MNSYLDQKNIKGRVIVMLNEIIGWARGAKRGEC